MPEDWGPRDKRQGRTNITCSVQIEHMLPFFSLTGATHILLVCPVMKYRDMWPGQPGTTYGTLIAEV